MSLKSNFEGKNYSQNYGLRVPKKKKLSISKNVLDLPRHDYIESSLAIASTFRASSATEHELRQNRSEQQIPLNMAYFTEKYQYKDFPTANIGQQMKIILNRKKNEIESLSIYRDELKFITMNSEKQRHICLSIQTLKEKVTTEEKASEIQSAVEKEIEKINQELETTRSYTKFMLGCLRKDSSFSIGEILDLEKEEEMMLNNLGMETSHIFKDLEEEQRKNNREVRIVQDQILDLRIQIKQKEDRLRDLKAKICTMYIKLNNRNNSRASSQSKNRNMSLSVKQFNNQNHSAIKQVYIGNNSFKSFSQQIVEKVTSEEELIKIKFYASSAENSNDCNRRPSQKFSFQCIYKSRDGLIQDRISREPENDNDATRDKISQASNKFEEIYVKQLLSMKFFYKSKIVGVECRVKTDHGNRHVQIGNCDPKIEHELLTLVNKKIVTLGSFWHGKQMIGISFWYINKPKLNSKNVDCSLYKNSGDASKSIKALNRPKFNTIQSEYYS